MIDTKAQEKNYLHISIQGSTWNVLTFIVTGIASFVSSVILTHYFQPEAYGLYAYVGWFTSIITLALNFGLSTAIQTWVPKYFFKGEMSTAQNIFRKLFKTQYILLFSSIFLLLPLILIWHRFTEFPQGIFTRLMVINISLIFCYLVSGLFSTLLASLQQFKRAAIITIVTQVLAVATVLIVVNFHLQLTGLLILVVLTNLVGLMLYYLYGRRLLFPATPKAEFTGHGPQPSLKSIIYFSGWAYVNVLLSNLIWDKSEFFFLGKFSSSQAIAIYGIAYTLGITAASLIDPILSVFTNLLSELVSKNDWQRVRLIISKTAKFVSLALLPIVTLSFLFARHVIQLIYPPAYIQVASIFPILFLSMVLSRIFLPAWSIPNYKHDLKKIVPRNIVLALLNIVLDIWLIPRYGIWGATIANIATQLSAVIYFGNFVKRYDIALFTGQYLKIILLNAGFLTLALLPFVQHLPLMPKVLFSIIGLLLYSYLAIKHFFNREDRSLFKQILLTVFHRTNQSYTT